MKIKYIQLRYGESNYKQLKKRKKEFCENLGINLNWENFVFTQIMEK